MRLGIVKLKNCIFHLPLLSPFTIFARLFFQKTMANTKEMTSGPSLPLIFNFTLPLLLGNLLQQTYSLVDAAIVGKWKISGNKRIGICGGQQLRNLSYTGIL